jgi:hypothetical protein
MRTVTFNMIELSALEALFRTFAADAIVKAQAVRTRSWGGMHLDCDQRSRPCVQISRSDVVELKFRISDSRNRGEGNLTFK